MTKAVLTEYHQMRLANEIEGALSYAQFVSQEAGSRELSLVITKLEEAQLWLSRVTTELYV